jgi:hypothetical protein
VKTELRLTDTNASSDSKGRTWGLDGSLFWWLVGGIGAGIIVFFALLVVLRSSLLTSLAVALIPVVLCMAYIFGLRQGKPPGYDRDLFEHVLRDSGFAPELSYLPHPLVDEDARDLTALDQTVRAESGAARIKGVLPLPQDPTAKPASR